MNEIEINGNKYHVAKLTVMQQFHISRRLAPIILALGQAVNSETMGAHQLAPVADMLSAMSDENSEYILRLCMSAVSRVQDGRMVKIQTANGAFMFDDIDMQVMMQLAAAVIKENLGNFLPGLPTLQ